MFWVKCKKNAILCVKSEDMSFKENMKSEITFQDMRVKELAEKTGINKRTLDHYLTENGSEPTAANAVLIAKALGVSVEYLVTGKDTNIPSSIKPEVIDIIREINHLSNGDLRFTKEMVRRLRVPIKE